MASGYCETAAYDWATASGHFDGRMARDCDSTTGLKSVYNSETNLAGRTLLGMQKWGACYGPNNSSTGCVNSSKSVSGCSIGTMAFNFDSTTNYATRWWRRNANGSSNFFDGGNPGDPTR